MESSQKELKNLYSNRIDILCKGIVALIYITCFVISGILMKNVIEQFQTKDTFMSQSFQPMTSMPTVVVCMSNGTWIYEQDFIIVYRVSDTKLYNNLTEKEILKVENEHVMVEQIGINCFKINSSLKAMPRRRGLGRRIYVRFTGDKMANNVNFYFTSEENSYGVYDKEWFNGNVFKETIKMNHEAAVVLKSIKYSYIQNHQHCTHDSFLDQWRSYIKNSIIKKCTKSCTPWTFLVSNNSYLCSWNDTDVIRCNTKAIHRTYKDFKTKINFKRACDVLEYTGQETYEGPYITNRIKLSYSFVQPVMTVEYKERYVFDFVGMVDSVGGTLGMCIGFSFTGIASTIIYYIKDKIKVFFF